MENFLTRLREGEGREENSQITLVLCCYMLRFESRRTWLMTQHKSNEKEKRRKLTRNEVVILFNS